MLANPSPMDRDFSVDLVDDYKRVDCRRYLRCLDDVVEHGWYQFHCNDCAAYEPETMVEREAAYQHMHKLLSLLSPPGRC